MKSLWIHWPFLQKRVAQAKHLLLFLDYDGTLAPIAAHPSKARLPERTEFLIKQLAHERGVWITLISGRALRDLKNLVRLRGLCYVGNHGLELAGPKLRYVNPVAQKSRPLLVEIARHLKQALQPVPGAWVEDKGLTLSVHYRSVAPNKQILIRNRFYEVLQPYQNKRQMEITFGKRVFEVRPRVRWTKGTIVNWLLARWIAKHKGEEVFPVYIGDDETDEDAFQAIGTQGITIAVGPSSPFTRAEYVVPSPRDVEQFLRKVLEICKEKKRGSHDAP
ncbi:MAG: trehalose-phosphatase [Candidatus Omnitrophica bacterium]|nr:trehalose-phosphatase [Candidatus Omnitrophota bacterium]